MLTLLKILAILVVTGGSSYGYFSNYRESVAEKNEVQEIQQEVVSEAVETVFVESSDKNTTSSVQDVEKKKADETVVSETTSSKVEDDKKKEKKKEETKKEDKSSDNGDSIASLSPGTNKKKVPVKRAASQGSPVAGNSVNAAFTATGFRNTEVYTYTTQVFQGDTVTFDASNSSGDIVSYDWDFGDGKKGTGKNVTNTYNTSSFNSFNVILTVSDKDGKTDHTNGYIIHYIGKPRMLISVDASPEGNAYKYACGQTIKASASTYSPYGEVEELEWELMRGAISHSSDSDKVLKTKMTGKDGTIEYSFDCDAASADAVLQERDRDAVYSFVVRKMTDSKGNKLIFDKDTMHGSKAIVVYVP